MPKFIALLTLLFALNILYSQSKIYEYKAPVNYNDAIPAPAEVLGYDIGERPVNYYETVNYLNLLSEKSPLIKIFQCGETHQGRKLYYLIVTSEENHQNLEGIKEGIKKLSDPGIINNSEAKSIINNSPAIALMMYSIHGNETSGTDASVLLTYHLAAAEDESIKELLNKLVIIIYPMENPDGRERFLSQVETWRGKVRNSDTQSFPHSGVWPSGRTNHYHFDLNRDWFILSQPESRARVKLLLEWNPQLVVDAHEMGSFSSFLFNPPREPINPNINKRISNWWKTFAKDQASAFDQYGKDYYTREWLEEWYPGYGSSYPSYHGAISILYEQARTSGIEVKQPEGTLLTFKEAIENQFISSLANLFTTANNKTEILKEYFEVKKEALNSLRKDGIKYFIIENKINKARVSKFIETLLLQKINIFKTDKEVIINSVKNYRNEDLTNYKFAKGSYIIPVQQTKQNLVRAILDFDTKLDNKFLKWERESLEKGEGTKLYEVSSWSLPIAYGVDAFVTKDIPELSLSKVDSVQTEFTDNNCNPPKYGYLIDFSEDNIYKLLVELFEKGYKIQSANKTFTIENKSYNRGTLLIRINENPNLNHNEIIELTNQYKIKIHCVNTALSTNGIDLGGDEFALLSAPKTAILVDQNTNMGNYGTINFLLDNEIGLRVSSISLSNISRFDLRKYNVIILPAFWGGADILKNRVGKSGIEAIKNWITNGGTFIAIESSAVALADSSLKFSSVKLRRQSISSLDQYMMAYKNELSAKNVVIDSLWIWEGEEKFKENKNSDKKEKVDNKELAEADRQNLKFMPSGAILDIELNTEHWLSFGAGEKVSAIYNSNYSFLSKPPVQTVGRIAGKDKMRISGLLWPEAKERLEFASYCTRESKGIGQIILFASDPNFRSYFYGSARLLLNSIFLAPGFGSSQNVEW